jgi:hypothetical protein
MVQDWQNRAFGLLTCDEQIDGLDGQAALRPGRGVSPKTDGFGHGRREQGCHRISKRSLPGMNRHRVFLSPATGRK